MRVSHFKLGVPSALPTTYKLEDASVARRALILAIDCNSLQSVINNSGSLVKVCASIKVYQCLMNTLKML